MLKYLRYINWSELSGLLVGAVIAIASCSAIFILVLKLDHENIIGKKEYILYSNFASGQGLHKGTTVQINGVDIGRVEEVSLADSVSSIGKGSVKLKLRLDAKYKKWITDLSVAYATRDQNIISERVINIDIAQKGSRILEDEEYLAAGTAQDIETVLKTANDVLVTANLLIERVDHLALAADTLISTIRDTNTTVGALLGSKILYDNLDSTVIRLLSLVSGADDIFKILNTGMPKIVAFADTFSTDAITLIGSLDSLSGSASGVINSLDSTIKNLGGMVNEFSSIAQPLGSLIKEGSQTLNRTDDVMTGVSKFWLLRSKIPQRDTISSMEDAW